jgi:hypothetical protein
MPHADRASCSIVGKLLRRADAHSNKRKPLNDARRQPKRAVKKSIELDQP